MGSARDLSGNTGAQPCPRENAAQNYVDLQRVLRENEKLSSPNWVQEERAREMANRAIDAHASNFFVGGPSLSTRMSPAVEG